MNKYILPLLLLLFTITRLVNLTLLPIGIDEANYLDWGWRETHTPNFLFYSLYDAKPPGVMWLFGLAQSAIPDPLLAGRLVTVLFGLVTVIGLYKISPNPLVLIAYSLVPLFLFFDRQALMESPLAAAGVWIYFLALRLRKTPSLSNALLLGTISGAAMLIKTNAALFLLPLPFILLSRRNFVPNAINFIFVLVGFVLGASPLLFQPQFWSTLASNSRYSLTTLEILRLPIVHWISNLWAYSQMAFWHLTPPIFLSILFGLFSNFKFQISNLSKYSLLPIAAVVLTSRSPSLRYLAPFLPLLLVPATNFLSDKDKPAHRLLQIFTFVSCFLVIGILLVNPPQYFRLLNRVTRFSEVSYVTGDNSGYQIASDLAFLKTLEAPVVVAVALNSGNPEAAIINYLRRWPGFTPTYLDSQILGINPSAFDCLSSPVPVYFVARRDQQAGLERFFRLKATVTNQHNSDFNNIYELRSGCPPEKTLSLTFTEN